MNNLIKTKGIVIKSVNVGDYDKIITILSPQYGKMDILAKGVRSLKNKNSPATSLFSFGNYIIKNKGQMYLLSSCEVTESFYALSEDIFTLSYASYFVALIKSATVHEKEEHDLFNLLLYSLHALKAHPEHRKTIKFVFEIRLIYHLGELPDFNTCSKCGKGGILYLSKDGNNVYCNTCKDTYSIYLSRPVLYAIKLSLCDIKRAFSFAVEDTIYENLKVISENYIKNCIGWPQKSLDFIYEIEKINK